MFSESLRNALQQEVVGQPDAIRAVVRGVTRLSSGLTPRERSWCAYLFIGPPGTGRGHLVRTLGRKRAYEVIVTGEKISAEKCLQWGLCNRVAPADKLLEETLAWAEEVASKAPLSLRYAKQAINAAQEQSVGETISNEARLQHICITSEDAKEGVVAFMQKRAPKWQGR